MINVLNILGVVLLLSFLSSNEVMEYPKTKKEDINEKIFGKNIQDPYRWLEDFTDENVIEWVNEQNKFTNEFLENDYQKKIKKDLKDIWITEDISIHSEEEIKLFIFLVMEKNSRPF